ncbi:hypothetical protein CLV71_103647 [Actinophytocola oryzae]|uniref:Uncharacterized protein n=1 Tax=Actinophytocola oryzae TaxID=502181 RepID=A0A4R7VYZ7_9PSEU|nr:hypothetical protein CLV71_103647 [Actinophytocola oryzae]
MRMRGSRVAGFAVLVTVFGLLLGGCQLREGPSSEYSDSMPAKTLTSHIGTEKN